MDPVYEQRLRDEVIYLHSVWHQGPPRSAAATAARHHHLPPVQTTHFKKENTRKRSKNPTFNTEPDSSPGLAWPVPSPPPTPPTDVWPTFKSNPDPNPQTLSPEEQSKLAARNAHHNALKALAAFFRSNKNSNADSDSDSDSDSTDSIGDEEDDSMDEDDGQEECDFFNKLFEDAKLRDYYEKSFARGEFSCLVCGALGGKKMGKKFKGCMALVQHSIAIAKTKRKRAHRAFGEAVCKVLGWDINRLSSIVSLLSDKPEEARETGSVDNKGIPVGGDIVYNEAVPEIGPIGTAISTNGDEGDTNSLTCNDVDKSSEGVDTVHDLEAPAADGLTNVCSSTFGSPRSAAAARRHHLLPAQTTHFKKESTRKRSKNPTFNTEPDSSPGLAWPVPSTPPTPPTDVWPTFKSNPDPNPQTPSPEEQSKLAARNAHHNALKALAVFFRSNKKSNADCDSDSDSDSDSTDSIGEEDNDSMDEDDGQEECDFFHKLFEDAKLRDYYEKSFATGEFSCLVCGALGGKKMGKKFKGCMALVQHSIAIAKTKRKRAHREFGEAVCKVLGWDINRLSSIVSSLSDKTEEARETGSVDNKVISVEGDIVNSKCNEAVPEIEHIGTAISINGDEGDTNSSTCNDVDKSSEGVDMVHDLEAPAADGLTNENVSVDNKENPPGIVELFLNAEGKTDEAIPESGAIIDAGISLKGDGDISLTDANKRLEVVGMVQEPATDSLTTSSLSSPGAHQNSENVGSVPSTSLAESQEVLKSVE